MALIFALSLSLIFPIFPNYIKSALQTDFNVSLFYAAMAIMMFVGALASTIIFSKYERSKVLKWSFILAAAAFVLLIFATEILSISGLRSITLWAKIFILSALALFVRDFTKSEQLGEEEGVFYRFSNIGYLLGPLIGGFVAARMGYEAVFFIAGASMIFGFLYFHYKHIVQKHPAIVNAPKTNVKDIIKNAKEFFSDKDRRKVYLITVVLMFWFGFKILYVPLFVVKSGYMENMSGLVLSLGMIPLIFFEVKVGKYADKKGIRIPIFAGFLTIALSLMAIFICPYPLINFALIVVAMLGASFIEPMQEYYLFNHLPQERQDALYGIYRTADPLAYFLAPLFGSLVLFFLPFRFLFLIAGLLILSIGVYLYYELKNN